MTPRRGEHDFIGSVDDGILAAQLEIGLIATLASTAAPRRHRGPLSA